MPFTSHDPVGKKSFSKITIGLASPDTILSWSHGEVTNPETIDGGLSLLRKGGRLVTYGRTTGREAITNLSKLFWNEQTLIGSTMGSLADFHEMMELVFHGTIDPIVDSVYPLDRAAEAYARYERGEQFGKIVLKVR